MRAPSDPSFLREARGLVVSVALAVALVGCATSPIASGPISTPTASPSAAATAESAPDYPVTVTDDEGTAVEIAERPERIVSLTPGTTETLFAIGVGNRVVAATDADDYPPEAVPLPDVASFGSVDLEAIAALEADLVIAGGNEYTPSEAIRSLRDLQVPVVVIYASTVDAVMADVELIGEAVGKVAEAQALAAEMRAEIDALVEAVAALPRPRVFYEVDASVGVFGPADDSYLAEMVELAGGEPITTGSSTSFEIELERLVAADPEVIILGDAAFGVTPQQVAARPAWDEMSAVRAGAIRAADDKLITRPGPRLALGLRSLILAIHPEATLP
ncbi:MAG: ABC transporter substrate-binding protein [Candidatus Limnocylindria bacterium]